MPDDPKLAVVEAVRSAILRGEYAPGQRLVEIDLCERFGTSRFLARSALHELSAQGLVEFERNRGARVREISLAEAIEITEVRRMLEGQLAARAAERATRAQAAALRVVAADMRAAVERSELLRYSDLNARLHAAIRDMSGHETGARLLRQLRDQTVRHQFTLALVPGRPAVSLPQHEAIVAAVTARDAAGAERAMRDHLQSVIEALHELRSLQARPAAQGPRARQGFPGERAHR
ncbi:MAG TPA: GntR family transcriptional regulator [Streptosporangiaceae bacterium]|nr:GntR family transcriptional regulator [Streptosporangiaceae bacterium]